MSPSMATKYIPAQSAAKASIEKTTYNNTLSSVRSFVDIASAVLTILFFSMTTYPLSTQTENTSAIYVDKKTSTRKI